MRRILLIGVLLSGNCEAGGDLIFLSGERLLTYCTDLDSESLARGICEGYLAGMMDTVTTLRGLDIARVNTCATPKVSPFRLRNAYLEWAEKHPQDMGAAASTVALLAMSEAFPCERPRKPAEPVEPAGPKAPVKPVQTPEADW